MKNSNDTANTLLTGNVFKTMLSLSIPAILGMVVIGLYNFMDAVFVGQMVTSQAMTAVKVSYPFTLINSGIATLIGTGSASVLSRAIGKKDQNTINKIMGNLMGVVLLLSIIVMVLGIAFAPQLLTLSGATDEILSEATRYLRLVYCGSLFVNFSQSANMVMRGEGKLKVAMTIMGAGAILNIVLDPILITVMGKENGVLGAALATVIAQFCQATYTLWYFRKKSDNVKLGRIGIDKTVLGPVLSVGVSAMLMQVMSMVQQTVMYNTAAKWGGGEWQTILGASLSLQAFSFIPLWGIAQGFQPAVGTNYGAKQFDRVRKFTKVFMIAATVLALVFYLPIMFAPGAMLSMFIKETAISTQGASMLRVLFISYISYGVMILAITFFQAIGKGGAAAAITLLRQLVLFVPLVVILPRFFARNVDGVFYAQLVTDSIVLVASLILMAKEFAGIRKEEKELSKAA
ncbi:MATE family efflux transporter [Butyrivibrio sp. XB500-5]|uniref:MATE family efflux transporter n=1 Tax=Butyrivibrio sp. XB500-5 TaxID=2364880 RepID=UPI000EA920BA|nr:MATE family efflux transporter [Butyrivibrio sp. XB500-5]RKM57718.1 MATE family efflux transporter [Butyrivibrio sp. XB500-5]